MTGRQLTTLRDALLKLYEEHHGELSPAEEFAIVQIRDFIYTLQEG